MQDIGLFSQYALNTGKIDARQTLHMRSESLVKYYSGMLNDFGSCMCLTGLYITHAAHRMPLALLCSVIQVQNPKQFSHGGHS